MFWIISVHVGGHLIDGLDLQVVVFHITSNLMLQPRLLQFIKIAVCYDYVLLIILAHWVSPMLYLVTCEVDMKIIIGIIYFEAKKSPKNTHFKFVFDKITMF